VEYIGYKKFNCFVELGNLYGGSLWLYAMLFCNRYAKIVGIDLGHKQSLKIIERELLKRNFNIKLYEKPAETVYTIFQQEIDLLHIDANHAKIQEDFELYYPAIVGFQREIISLLTLLLKRLQKS